MAGGSGSNLGAPGMPGGASSMGDPLGLFGGSRRTMTPGEIAQAQGGGGQSQRGNAFGGGFGGASGYRGQGQGFSESDFGGPAGNGPDPYAGMQGMAQALRGSMLGNTPGMNAPAPQLGPMQSWMGMQIPGGAPIGSSGPQAPQFSGGMPATQAPQWADGPSTQGGQYVGQAPSPHNTRQPWTALGGAPQPQFNPMQGGPARFQGGRRGAPMPQMQGGGFQQQRGSARAGLLSMLGEPGG